MVVPAYIVFSFYSFYMVLHLFHALKLFFFFNRIITLWILSLLTKRDAARDLQIWNERDKHDKSLCGKHQLKIILGLSGRNVMGMSGASMSSAASTFPIIKETASFASDMS